MLFSACDPTEEPIDNPVNSSADYFPLAIGNYWVYNNYLIDSNGTETLLTDIDSIVINRDTLIRGNTYYIMEGVSYPYNIWRTENILRDSSNYIVDNTGRIIFSDSDFNNTLYENDVIVGTDTLVSSYYFMEQVSNTINTVAGAFDSIYNYKGVVTSTFPGYPSSFPDIYNYYAPNVGRVLKNYYFIPTVTFTKKYYEKRLLRYYID